MNEYIFFDANLQNKFVEFATQLGISSTLHDDQMGLVVAIPEDTGEDLEDALEERYDELQAEQSRLLTQQEGGLKQLAGFRYNLPNGQSRMAPLETDTANRLLSIFSIEEIQALFERVARSALSQEEKPLCKLLAEETQRTTD